MARIMANEHRTEHGHDGIADELLDRPAVPLDLPPESVEIGAQSGPDVLGVGLI
jgi:hypothetical protein